MAAFNNRPQNVQLSAYYKGDYDLLFSFTSGGSPYSLAGASAAFTIYDKKRTSVLALSGGSGLTISGAAGTIALAITNAQMVALATQEYDYEFIVTEADTTVWPVLDSTFIVSEDGNPATGDTSTSVTSKGVTITITQN